MNKDDLVKLQQKVTTLRAEGKYKESIENCYDLQEGGMKLKDYKSILTAYVNLAASYYCVGDIDAAFHSIGAHNEICEEFGDEIDLLNSYNIMFLLYAYNKEWDKSMETLEKSIIIGKKLGKYNIISNGYSNLSHALIQKGDYDKAYEMAIIGLEMAKQHAPSSPILELRVKLNIADALIGLENLAASKVLIDELVNDSVLDSFIREKAQCNTLQGHWYNKMNLYPEAFASFTNAKYLVESYHDLYLLKEIQGERCKLCELMNDINLGYKVQKEYISLLNEISQKELDQTALKLEIKHSIISMKKKANTDYLTGLYNRNYIESMTNDWLKQAHQNRESIACIVFDIDNFKTINDTYGHLFGDEIIKRVSNACSSILRENDIFGRYGGDEFVIILKGTTLEGAKKKAEQILDTVRNLKLEKDGVQISITISIGVTDNLSSVSTHFTELFHSADIVMYRAKQSGRNKVCICQ